MLTRSLRSLIHDQRNSKDPYPSYHVQQKPNVRMVTSCIIQPPASQFVVQLPATPVLMPHSLSPSSPTSPLLSPYAPDSSNVPQNCPPCTPARAYTTSPGNHDTVFAESTCKSTSGLGISSCGQPHWVSGRPWRDRRPCSA